MRPVINTYTYLKALINFTRVNPTFWVEILALCKKNNLQVVFYPAKLGVDYYDNVSCYPE